MPMSSFVIATSQSGKFAELNDTLENLKSLKELTQADLAMATQMADAKYKAVSKDIEQANQQRNAVI
jgi:inosine/xanthosine triphosphate pyrophosphatase family protein